MNATTDDNAVNLHVTSESLAIKPVVEANDVSFGHGTPAAIVVTAHYLLRAINVAQDGGANPHSPV